MSLLRRSPEVGDRVRAARDLRDGVMDHLVGRTSVRSGRQGIVRAVHQGLLVARYDVEFDTGWGTRRVNRLPERKLRLACRGHGEAAWARRRDLSVGLRLGAFAVLGLPAAFALFRHFANGGSGGQLVSVLAQEAMALAGDMLGLAGPLAPLVAAVAVLAVIGALR